MKTMTTMMAVRDGGQQTMRRGRRGGGRLLQKLELRLGRRSACYSQRAANKMSATHLLQGQQLKRTQQRELYQQPEWRRPKLLARG